MSTLTLEVPPSTIAKWNALPEDERQRRAATIIETIEAPGERKDISDIHAAIAEGIADADAGRFITYGVLLAADKAHWKEKGLDFDAALKTARPLIEE